MTSVSNRDACNLLHVDEGDTLAEVDSETEFSWTTAVGSGLREAAVLVLVFGFLDPLVKIEPKAGTSRFDGLTWGWSLMVVTASVILFSIGGALEAYFKRQLK